MSCKSSLLSNCFPRSVSSSGEQRYSFSGRRPFSSVLNIRDHHMLLWTAAEARPTGGDTNHLSIVYSAEALNGKPKDADESTSARVIAENSERERDIRGEEGSFGVCAVATAAAQVLLSRNSSLSLYPERIFSWHSFALSQHFLPPAHVSSIGINASIAIPASRPRLCRI